MNYFFAFLTGLFLILIQTGIFPCFYVFQNFYDLLIPLILFFALYRPMRESIAIVIFWGIVMDSLSGGPFGIYLTTYLWMLVIVKWVITFLAISNTVILIFIVALGVLLENLFYFAPTALAEGGFNFNFSNLYGVFIQILWAILTGFLFLQGINYSCNIFSLGISRLFTLIKEGQR